MQYLYDWKEKDDRKPLIVRGARQVGKTWLMKEFGRNKYYQTAYINFESSKHLKNLFIDDYDIERIVSAIQIETGIPVSDKNTLIILDEIQEAEGCITSLKYFYETAPQYHIIAAGSLLGITLHKNTSFPVGKVDLLDLHPLSFPEFLLAMDQQSLLQLTEKQDWRLIRSFKIKYKQLLKQYYFTGGMPEALMSYIKYGDYGRVRQIQNRILAGYEQDFSKHAPSRIVPRIRMLWNSIPSQLAKENKKFIYGVLKKGSRAKDFELALSWLADSGLIYKISRITKPGIPLKAYEDLDAFKLFIVDIGLMAAMVNIDARTLLKDNKIFEEFKGALTEQFVLQQLNDLADVSVYYWTASAGKAEVDFVVQRSGTIFPVEVKAEENLKAKSLKLFIQKYPQTKAIRTSMADHREEDWMINLPLYAIHTLQFL